MANESQALKYDKTRAVLEEFAQAVCEAYRKGLEGYDALASRKLYQSVSVHTVDTTGGMLKVSINLMDYWKFVEAGRQAYGKEGYKGHLPPIKAIEDWIEWKHIVPGDTRSGVPNYAALTPNLSALNVAKNTNGLAWAIATKIAQNGIAPKPILANSVEESLNRFKDRIAEALAEDVGGSFQVIVGDMWKGVNLGKVNGDWTDQTVTDIMVI